MRARLIALAMISLGVGSPLQAAVADPWNTLYDGWDGITCAYFNSGARIKWKVRQGDWVDAAGQKQGNLPYAEAFVQATGREQMVQWDVTALVRAWTRGAFPNTGMLLAPVKGKPNNDTAVFLSREAPEAGARPQLLVRFGDGKEIRFSAKADAELNCSTVVSMGQNTSLKVGSSRYAAIQFDLPLLDRVDLERATLLLVAGAHQYGNNTIGVYRIEAPVQPRPGPTQAGIAAGFVGDRGIEQHPDVIFATGFESLLWRTQWSYVSLTSSVDRIDHDEALRFAPFQGHALRVTIPKKYNQGLDMGFEFRDHAGGEPEEIYFRYYLRFADDWNPGEDGGKLPGPAGTYGKAGWGGRKADAREGWSMRGQFGKELSTENPFYGRIPIGTYAYHASGEDLWGDPWNWMGQGLGLLERNRWYCIEQYFRVNTIGKRDGVMRAWIDGRLAFEQTDVRVRDVTSIKIEKIWMNVYYGGTAPAPRDMRLFIDNVVIARKYIGPVGMR